MEKPNNSILSDYENITKRLDQRKGFTAGTEPAVNYSSFLVEAQALFIKKDTDYDSRFLRGLIVLDAPTIWRWEVDKKLDRLRSWIKRGELQVKGEGVRNSIDDLFIYTVQYVAYIQEVVNDQTDPQLFLKDVREGRGAFFWHYASRLTVEEWVEFLVKKGRIKENETLLQAFIKDQMGLRQTAEDWRRAINSILKE